MLIIGVVDQVRNNNNINKLRCEVVVDAGSTDTDINTLIIFTKGLKDLLNGKEKSQKYTDSPRENKRRYR